jgi:hypothetical protein
MLKSRRARPAPFLARGTLLASLCLLPSGLRILADEPKPTPPPDQSGAQEQAEAKKKSEQTGRPEPETQSAPRPASREKQVPAAKAGRTAGAETHAAKPAGAAAQPAHTPEPVLRFSDDDLEKYHRKVPEEADEAEDEAGGTPEAAEATPAGKSAKRPRSGIRSAPLAVAPETDPLKPFKDREAQEKFRKMQIETGRERIAKLQARLDYLNTKRDALTNPAPLLVGQTRGPANPGNPTSGPGKVQIGGFFPPIPPPQTDEDKENDKKLKVKDLLEQVDKEIKSVQEELDTARAELASVETRFAQESQSR